MVSVQIAMFSQLSRIERLLLLTPAYPNLQVVRTYQARPFHVLKSVFHVDFRTWWSEQVPFFLFLRHKVDIFKALLKAPKSLFSHVCRSHGARQFHILKSIWAARVRL